MKKIFLIVLLLSTTALTSCSLAPPLKTPEVHVPAHFKEAGALPEGCWKKAAPAAHVDRGEWWKVFSDEKLNALQTEAAESSQTLKSAAARVTQARALSDASRAGLTPHLDLGAGPQRTKSSRDALGAAADPRARTLYTAEASVSYEADLFKKIGDEAYASKKDAAAAEATYKSVLLALQADVAENYFLLRMLDADIDILIKTMTLREENFRIIKQRFDAGDVNEQDLARAETDLALVKAELLNAQRLRAAAEHALALLLGKTPGQKNILPNKLSGAPPAIPAGLPSALLERRPDIVAAQETLAAANARIGVAKAAFFPSISLSATGGYSATHLNELFNWSTRSWVLGPLVGTVLSLPVFDGGRNKAQLALKNAEFEEAVSDYRQQVLVAFKEVEDSLSNLRLYAAQMKAQEKAVKAARRAADLSDVRYKEGLVSYLEVVDARRVMLEAERAALQTLYARFVETVTFIRVLGGGWDQNDSQSRI